MIEIPVIKTLVLSVCLRLRTCHVCLMSFHSFLKKCTLQFTSRLNWQRAQNITLEPICISRPLKCCCCTSERPNSNTLLLYARLVVVISIWIWFSNDLKISDCLFFVSTCSVTLLLHSYIWLVWIRVDVSTLIFLPHVCWEKSFLGLLASKNRPFLLVMFQMACRMIFNAAFFLSLHMHADRPGWRLMHSGFSVRPTMHSSLVH